MKTKTLGWLGVLLLAGSAGAQVAAAKADAKGKVPAATVKADDDKGLVGEIPVNTPDVPDPKDVSAVGSPTAGLRGGAEAVRIKASTAVNVTLTQAVSSGVQRNGAMLEGVLAGPVTASDGRVMKAGTPVQVTVLSVAKAGMVQSAGVLSLQVVRVGGVAVTTDVLEFLGQEGHRDVADANPEKGTEAMVQAGAPLKFQVLGSGDKFDGNETAGKGGSSVSVGAGTVSAPAGFARPAAGTTTAIHGATTPR